MLEWSLILLVISVLTGFAGFSRHGSALAGPARAVFFITAAMLLAACALNLFGLQ